MPAKKQRPVKGQRTDAERRVRQCERLSRLFRVFHCITGPGRWDAEGLARELEVSHRTIHRLMQTLSMAGVPWHYSKEEQCYRVRPGFRFPGLGRGSTDKPPNGLQPTVLAANQLMHDTEAFLHALRQFCNSIVSTGING